MRVDSVAFPRVIRPFPTVAYNKNYENSDSFALFRNLNMRLLQNCSNMSKREKSND